jgi:acetolactate synthase-1/2/3 large subunit
VDRSAWVEYLQGLRSTGARRDIQNLPDNGQLHAAHVIHDLRRITNGDATLVTDVGQHQMWAAQYYRVDKPHTWISSGGLGTMGFGLPAGIGAKLATPDRDVWVIAGDGGFQMTQAELSTAAQEGIKVNVAVINNGYLGMVRQWQEFFYQRRYAATPLRNPDFVKIAEAHGLTGLRVSRRCEVEDAIRRAEETEGTVVIDFRVVPEDTVYPMVPSGADLHDMIRRPDPMME